MNSLPQESVLSSCCWIFLIIWALFGISINERDQRAYTLQHAGPEAIVEYQTFSLWHSKAAELRRVGDTFELEGKILAAKQPGQFVISGLAYFVLRIFGLQYESNYLLTASLVTWFSSSLLAALGASAIFLVCRKCWGLARINSTITAFSYALASILFPYAGVAHHDVLALSFLVLSFAAIELARPMPKARLFLLAGVAAGLTLFCSMLPALLVLTSIAFVLLTKAPKSSAYFLSGLVLGLLPLLLYNFHYFGNPVIQANIAGDFRDTFFSFSWNRFVDRVFIYFGWGSISIWKYMPWIGIGLASSSFSRSLRPELRVFFSASAIIHCFYIMNIETIGHCQFGPRYLLPLVPIGALSAAASANEGRVLRVILAMLIAYALAVNTTGAFGGTMYCGLSEFAPINYLNDITRWRDNSWPVAPYAGCLIVVITGGLIVKHYGEKYRAAPQ